MTPLAQTYESLRSTHPAFDQALAQRWGQLPPDKIQQHIKRQLQHAGIPSSFRDTSFATLDPTWDPAAFSTAQAYAQQGEYGGKPGLLLVGPPGCGKTALSLAVLRQTVEQTKGRFSVCFWNVPQGLARIRQSFGDDQSQAGSILDVVYNRLVVLDDLGKQKMTEWVAEQFYTLIDRLWADGKQTVITTNLDVRRMGDQLDETLVSRILGMCHVVVLQEGDRRLQPKNTPRRKG